MSLTFSSTARSDYNDPVVTAVTFGPDVTSASYPVPIVDDSNKESPESFAALMSTVESNVNFGENIAIITILDNDRKLFLHHIHKEEYWCVALSTPGAHAQFELALSCACAVHYILRLSPPKNRYLIC